MAQAMDPAFARSLELPGASLEGYLFPDTYHLRPHMPAARALVALVRRHRQVFEELRAAHPLEWPCSRTSWVSTTRAS